MNSSPPRYALCIGGTGLISQYVVEALHADGFLVATMNRGRSIDLHGHKVSHRFIVNCNQRKLFIKALQTSVSDFHAALHATSIQDAEKSRIPPPPPRAWDVVIDFICYDPAHASAVCEGLSDRAKLFIMISTDSVYEVCKPLSQYLVTDNHPLGRREQFDELLNLSDSKLRKIDEYGYEKWLSERVFTDFAKSQRSNPKITFPFNPVYFRLPDVCGEREAPRNRHFQLQSRIELGLPIFIDPDVNRYNVDTMALPNHQQLDHLISQQTEDKNQNIFTQTRPLNLLPPGQLPQNAFKLSFVHAKDVAAAIVACHRSYSAYIQIHNEEIRQKHPFASINNKALNIGSTEQVSLLEYVYLIGNSLGKPVYVYGSSEARDKLLQKSYFVQLSHLLSRNPSNGPLLYPQSYSSLYFTHILNYYSHISTYGESTNIKENAEQSLKIIENTVIPSNTAVPGLPTGRIDLRPLLTANLVLSLNSNDSTQKSPLPHDTSSILLQMNTYQLATIFPTPQHIIPHAQRELHTNPNDCAMCQNFVYKASPQSYRSAQLEFIPRYLETTMIAEEYLMRSLQLGYECDLSTSSSSCSSNSESSTSADDSDYDIPLPILSLTQNTAPTSTRKGKIADIVKTVLAAQVPTQKTTHIELKYTQEMNTILTMFTQFEDNDQYSYLPSVTQGAIDISSALAALGPFGWKPHCLYQWASAQSLWYHYELFINMLNVEARNVLWEMDERWGKYFK